MAVPNLYTLHVDPELALITANESGLDFCEQRDRCALRTGASARMLSPRAARSEAIMMLMALLRMPSIACLRSSLASPRTQIRNGQLVVSCDRSNWQILP